jgi:hypothetical protein
MPSERRFRDDGTKATRFYEPNDGDDRMNENDEDVAHASNGINTSKTTSLRPIWQFAIDRSSDQKQSADASPMTVFARWVPSPPSDLRFSGTLVDQTAQEINDMKSDTRASSRALVKIPA